LLDDCRKKILFRMNGIMIWKSGIPFQV